jgi:protein arginine kinase activator
MKCHRCPKVATLHITELVKGEAHELHLCEECAHNYLQNPDAGDGETGAGGLIKPPSGIGEAELEALEKLVCPTCKMTFREFRNQGRLGCSHCYIAFREELLPLLENIHGDTHHCWPWPKSRTKKQPVCAIRFRTWKAEPPRKRPSRGDESTWN